MSSNADLSVALFAISGLEPSARETLRQEAALLDRAWRALRDIGVDAAQIAMDADEPEGQRQGLPSNATRNGRLSVAR